MIDGIKAAFFDIPCAHDIIVGRYLIQRAGIDFQFTEGTMSWPGHSVLRKPTGYYQTIDDYWMIEDNHDVA